MKRQFVFIGSWALLATFSAHTMNVSMFLAKKSVRTVHANRLPVRSAQRFRSFEVKSTQDVEKITRITDPYFADVPGYPRLKNQLDKALKNPHRYTAKGYVYELEVALYFLEKENQTICAFEKKYTHPLARFTREIDIITDSCAIECKNIDWDSVQRSEYISSLIARQFCEQNELVHSGVVGVPYFMLCSKNQIPFTWKVWLAQRGIFYMEGPQYDGAPGEFSS